MSNQKKGSIARLLVSALTAAALAELASCGQVVERESTDGNTSFLAPCDTSDNCPSTLECLCGMCSRACTSENACSAFPSATCARPVVVGLECPLRGSLCVSRGGIPQEAGAGASGGVGASGGEGGEDGKGGASPSGGSASGGAANGGAASRGNGGATDTGGTGNASGGTGTGGSEPDGAVDAGFCRTLDLPDAGAPCTLDICAEGDGYQIRVTRESGWYVGALWWNIVVCDHFVSPENYIGGETTTVAFRVPAEVLAAMDKNAHVYAYYGSGPEPSPAGPAADCGTLNSRLALPTPITECSPTPGG
jgi:hypothetical protein